MSNHRYDKRQAVLDFYKSLPLPAQTSNGDEAAHAGQNYYANYTKGLPHNALGEVVDYQPFLDAIHSGAPLLFDDIPLGAATAGCLAPGSVPAPPMRLTDPQAGLAYDTQGLDGHALTLPPAFKFNSPDEIGEIAENYWMALTRDIAFSEYDTNALAKDAAADLSKYSRFHGPKQGGKVTTQTLFRGLDSDIVGPHLSQFMILDIPYGAQKIMPQIAYGLPDKDYMIAETDYLAAQNGCANMVDKVAPVATPHLMYRGRDLAQYVHIDELYQAYLNACLLLITPQDRGGMGAWIDPRNPYTGHVAHNTPPIRRSTQVGFATMGEPNFKTLVTEVATRALKAVWYQKWFVHRRLRPEVFAARVHFTLTGAAGSKYKFDAGELTKLKADVLPRVKAANAAHGASNSWLLPMAFPEGSPTHPSYGAGHATVAGACVTVLKALFDETARLTTDLGLTPMVPANKGMNLTPYTGADKDQLTVGSELNKLASNVGMARNIAGVHWRSDYIESVKLGERIALYLLQEHAQTYNEDVSFFVTRIGATHPTIISKDMGFQTF